MPKKSAGILVYKIEEGIVKVLLAHPGGPFWSKKDEGSWSIPKGEFENEDALTAAKREFKEETGVDLIGEFKKMQACKQKSGKTIYAFSILADIDTNNIRSNFFSMEWPPGSGKLKEFPEIDKASWFEPAIARLKILPGQLPILEELYTTLIPPAKS